jgi:hypothetical protein
MGWIGNSLPWFTKTDLLEMCVALVALIVCGVVALVMKLTKKKEDDGDGME